MFAIAASLVLLSCPCCWTAQRMRISVLSRPNFFMYLKLSPHPVCAKVIISWSLLLVLRLGLTMKFCELFCDIICSRRVGNRQKRPTVVDKKAQIEPQNGGRQWCALQRHAQLTAFIKCIRRLSRGRGIAYPISGFFIENLFKNIKGLVGRCHHQC